MILFRQLWGSEVLDFSLSGGFLGDCVPYHDEGYCVIREDCVLHRLSKLSLVLQSARVYLPCSNVPVPGAHHILLPWHHSAGSNCRPRTHVHSQGSLTPHLLNQIMSCHVYCSDGHVAQAHSVVRCCKPSLLFIWSCFWVHNQLWIL